MMMQQKYSQICFFSRKSQLLSEVLLPLVYLERSHSIAQLLGHTYNFSSFPPSFLLPISLAFSQPNFQCHESCISNTTVYSGGSYSLLFFPPYLPFHASAPSHSQVDLLLHIIIIIQSFTIYTVIAAEFIVERDKSTFHTIGIYLLLDISVLSFLIFISIHDALHVHLFLVCWVTTMMRLCTLHMPSSVCSLHINGTALVCIGK